MNAATNQTKQEWLLGMPYSRCCAAPEEVVVVVPGRARLPDDALEDGREGHG